MTPDEVATLVRLAHETRGVEFKTSGSLRDTRFAAKIVRAMLGMANRRNGGYVLVGVSDDHDSIQVTGLTDVDSATWNHDDLADAVAKYADPSIEFETLKTDLDNNGIFAIKVNEFDDVPVFCKREFPEVLAKRLYVRSRRKPETSEVATAEDMRDVIEIAVDKQLQKWLRRGIDAGVIHVASPTPIASDRDKFSDELGDLA